MTDLEESLVPPERWNSCGAPPDAVALARAESESGVPTGLAHAPRLGWVVLQSSGQGPYVIWSEREE